MCTWVGVYRFMKYAAVSTLIIQKKNYIWHLGMFQNKYTYTMNKFLYGKLFKLRYELYSYYKFSNCHVMYQLTY